MATTFGDRIRLFALSVDIIGPSRFGKITRLIGKYCRETLDISTVRMMLVDTADPTYLRRHSLGSGLDRPERDVALKDANNRPATQTAAAFLKNKPMWIVSGSGKQKLEGSSTYKDLWSKSKGIPAFRVIGGSVADLAIKTSIIVPLRRDHRAIGVMNFETEEYLEITEEAKLELTKISQAVSILVRLLHSSERQLSCTEQALDALAGDLTQPQPKLTKPKIFIASSARSEKEVVDLILEIVKKFEDRLDLVYWKTMTDPGNISEHLFEAIENCRFAICYFSEKTDDGKYQDNPNVLFEAGMFHGRRDGISLVPASWLPVREEQSPDVPFDFAQQRTIIVQRTKTGKLKKRPLVKNLREGLVGMIRTRSGNRQSP